MQNLADEVATFIGTNAVVRSGTRALPAQSYQQQQPFGQQQYGSSMPQYGSQGQSVQF